MSDSIYYAMSTPPPIKKVKLNPGDITDGIKLFMEAISVNNIGIVQRILSMACVNINYDVRLAALKVACEKEFVDLVGVLLRNESKLMVGNTGLKSIVFQYGCSAGNLDFIRLSQDGLRNDWYEGYTAAVEYSHHNVLKYFNDQKIHLRPRIYRAALQLALVKNSVSCMTEILYNIENAHLVIDWAGAILSAAADGRYEVLEYSLYIVHTTTTTYEAVLRLLISAPATLLTTGIVELVTAKIHPSRVAQIYNYVAATITNKAPPRIVITGSDCVTIE